MPRLDGLGLLRALRQAGEDATTVILTAQGTVDTAVEALKQGAYDYLAKPVDFQRLRILLDKIIERQATLREVKTLRRQLRERGSFGSMIGASPKMRENLPAHRAGGADNRLGAHHRRVGHRQGAGRADDPPAEPAGVGPVGAAQLRRDSRDAARIGALRPRAGRVHRRDRAAGRRLRARAPRHALPRRDRRDDAVDAR